MSVSGKQDSFALVTSHLSSAADGKNQGHVSTGVAAASARRVTRGGFHNPDLLKRNGGFDVNIKVIVER